jgi:hypothetical protein
MRNQVAGKRRSERGVNDETLKPNIVGLPLTLKGKSADDGNPFSLGYKKSVKDIISDMKTRALTRQDPSSG